MDLGSFLCDIYKCRAISSFQELHTPLPGSIYATLNSYYTVLRILVLVYANMTSDNAKTKGYNIYRESNILYNDDNNK